MNDALTMSIIKRSGNGLEDADDLGFWDAACHTPPGGYAAFPLYLRGGA